MSCDEERMSVDEIVEAISSEDDHLQLLGTESARKMVIGESTASIDLLIGHDMVPTFVGFLQKNEHPMLQFEAAWVLVNIASGTSDQTRCVIENNAVPHLAKLLQSGFIDLADQAVCALANIASDGAASRDIIIQHNVIENIMPLTNRRSPITILRSIAWLMSNLCSHQNPPPPLDEVKTFVPVLSKLMLSHDAQVLTEACCTLYCILERDHSMIQVLIDLGSVPHLAQLIQKFEPSIVTPALRIVGIIVAASDEQTEVVIASGALPWIRILLYHYKAEIVEDAAAVINTITARSQQRIQAAIQAEVFDGVREVLKKGNLRAKEQAAWAVTNAMSFGTPEQIIEQLIDRFMILKPYLNLLSADDTGILKAVLTGLCNLFVLIEKLGLTESFSEVVIEMGGLDKLESLLMHDSMVVYKKAKTIIYDYIIIPTATF
ncbi:importin subunit alpha-like [Drosophila eugracilis]|uniref:importin subunit alpha-like n=1 Tax=Drosophila eugracilis TaxID=29029 RepID=UPI0007E677ED|nr:importin subunit alpha-like [Drosophila eugracilis]